MSDQVNDFVYQWYMSPKQTLALESLQDPKVKEVMYGGAKGGGKSYFGCRWAFLQAKMLIDQFCIEDPLAWQIPIGFIGRKRSTDFTKTTLETWKKCIPPDMYKIRAYDKEIVIEDRVKILYGGMDDNSTVKKFNSAEFAFVFIDQAEEMSKTDLALLKGTLRLVYNNVKPEYKVLLTANPAPCFLRQDYIDNPPKDGSKVFIQALPSDNPYLPKEYVSNLKEAFQHRPELVDAYVNGSWDIVEGSDVLIKHSWVVDNIGNMIHDDHDRRVTSCDVARFGNDETVIYNFIDNKIVGEKIYGQKDASITVNNIVAMASDNGSSIIAIDGDGMGGPVVDMVKKLLSDVNSKAIVMEINSGKKAEQEEKFVNARSEMWFHAADLLAKKECCLPNDPVLTGQLSMVKYDPNGPNGKFKIEKKEDIKGRIDSSPDRADAFVYGLWAVSKVPSKKYRYDSLNMSDELRDKVFSGYGWGSPGAYYDSWKY